MIRKNVYTGKPIEKKYQYTPAVIAVKAGLVFVSGQAGWDENGNILGADDPAAQARKAFENLRELLEAAGSSLSNVISEHEYVTDLRSYRDIAKVRQEFFPDNFPAATLVEVSKLFKRHQCFEIDAVAIVE